MRSTHILAANLIGLEIVTSVTDLRSFLEHVQRCGLPGSSDCHFFRWLLWRMTMDISPGGSKTLFRCQRGAASYVHHWWPYVTDTDADYNPWIESNVSFNNLWLSPIETDVFSTGSSRALPEIFPVTIRPSVVTVDHLTVVNHPGYLRWSLWRCSTVLFAKCFCWMPSPAEEFDQLKLGAG